ncbi:hypothetical protein [Zhongshania aliphaticivorans]|uniref:hypothetical protein n=1 Tax=Zhongshania aliphaticivorans TaxID=1470434 RepID=UPI0012E47DBE|nr:hypothetical protein [Zhongshania aliphaticivorans]CAA0083116.1 Uncharacterised protein [Zhongshania aliphaticivorans]
MKTNTLALSLTLAASLLVACGGGGDARSPDRPSPGLDPSSLRIDFPNGNQLAGTGTNSIQARMLALQTDGVENNLGPELNVTAGTQWTLGGSIGSPAIAKLADAVRDAGQLRDVLDIISTVRLASTDTLKNLTITGKYPLKGTTYTITEPFTVVPPLVSGPKYISGQTVIAFNPSNPAAKVNASYKLLQKLQGLPGVTENSTANATFCSDKNTIFTFGTTSTDASGEAFAPATISNPFTPSNQSQVSVRIKAIEKGVPCNDPSEVEIASLIIELVPAVVSKVAICAVTNPAADACDSSQIFFNATNYLNDCKGLNETTIKVPAAQRLQLVAELTYTNPQNPNQAPITAYQCSSPDILAWSASPVPTTIFAEGPDEDDGDASLIGQNEYDALAIEDRVNTVKGTYTNSNTGSIISDSLDLQLVDAEVTAITIVRADGETPPNNADTIFLNVFNDGIDYIAMCTFKDFDSTDTIACPEAFVDWELNNTDRLSVNPKENSNTTTVNPKDDAVAGDSIVLLRARYTDGISDVEATRTINAIDDEVVELHLYQASNANSPDDVSIDEFSCVGRTDLVGTVADGENYLRGNQRFYAFALFESGADDMSDAFLANPKADDSPLVDVTDRERLIFSALSGYWSGNASASPSCVSSAAPSLPGTDSLPGLDQLPGFDQLPGLDQIPGLPETSSTPAASFSGQTKGSLESRGLLRLSTVCVQAFIDSDDDGFTEGDIVTQEGSTVLILPAADDDLLIFSNELCETLEPVLTLGGNFPGLEGPGIVLPLVYTISTIADPILTALATNDDGGAIPGEEIVNALITGNFSTINENLPDSPIGGLGQVTNGLLGDGSPLSPVITALDACVVDPLTTVVGTLLDALLGLNPGAFSELTGISFDDCQDVFGNFSIPTLPGGAPGLPSIPGLPTP